MKCGGMKGSPEHFPVNMEVNEGCALAQSFSNMCMDWLQGRTIDRFYYEASIGSTRATEHAFADDVIVLIQSQEALVLVLKALHKEAKSLGFQVS